MRIRSWFERREERGERIGEKREREERGYVACLSRGKGAEKKDSEV